MATQLERDILQQAKGDLAELWRVIQREHNKKTEIAAPHEPLFNAATKAINAGGDRYCVFAEIIRGHCYAYYLADKQKLAQNWKHFIGVIRAC